MHDLLIILKGLAFLLYIIALEVLSWYIVYLIMKPFVT